MHAPVLSSSTPSSSLALPQRQGVHWPQDSSTKNSRKFSATSRMSRCGPMTMTEPPVGMSSKASARPKSLRRHADAAAPPICTALASLAADLREQLGDGDAPGELVDARLLTVAGDAEQLVAGRLVGAEALEPVDALGEDAGHRGERLDVVDDGRLVEQAGDHRERRPVARLAAEALERLDERRLLAADVGAGAQGDDDVEVEAVVAAGCRWPSRPASRRRWMTSLRCGRR